MPSSKWEIASSFREKRAELLAKTNTGFVSILIVLLLLPHLAGAAQVEERGIVFEADEAKWIRETAPALFRTRDRLFFRYGAVNDSGLVVLITENRDRFIAELGPGFPDWGVGAAQPYSNRIILQAPGSRPLDEPYVQIVGHEYGHIYLHRLAGGPADIPRWFDEGFAMFAGFDWSLESFVRLGRAVVADNLLSLKELEDVNRFQAEKAALAYTESFAAFEFLQENYGRDAVVNLTKAFGRGLTPDQAFWQVLGIGYPEFAAAFQDSVRRRYNLVSLFADTGLIWALLAVFIIAAWLIKKKRAKQIERRWRIEDRIHGEADFNEYVDRDDDESWRGGGDARV
jgi:hypothetical protein